MKNISFLLALIIACLIQSTWLDSFKIFNTKPDLILIAVLLSIILLDNKWAIFLAILGGVLKDSLGVNPFGLNSILFLCWFILIKRVVKEMEIEDNFRRAILILIIVFLHNLITGLFLVYTGRYIAPGIFLRNLLLVLLYAAAVIPLAFKLTRDL